MTDCRRLAQSACVAPDRAVVPESPVEGPPPFRALFETEFPYVFTALKRLGVRDSDLEDVTHDVFVAVYRSLPNYDATRPLRPWLFGTAFRVASDYRRLARHRRERLGDADAEPVDDEPAADDQVEATEERLLVVEALDALDLDRRAVLVMHDIDGHSIPDVADALSIPLNTAYSRLRIAREQFRAAIHRLRARQDHRRKARSPRVADARAGALGPPSREGGKG